MGLYPVNNAQDIFPAISGNLVHNGALIVNPGSPVSFTTGVTALCVANLGQSGLSQGNGAWTSWGINGKIMLNYPSITGVAVTGLGKTANSSTTYGISGQYHVVTEPRWDAVRYYTVGVSGGIGQYGNPESISGTYNA